MARNICIQTPGHSKHFLEWFVYIFTSTKAHLPFRAPRTNEIHIWREKTGIFCLEKQIWGIFKLYQVIWTTYTSYWDINHFQLLKKVTNINFIYWYIIHKKLKAEETFPPYGTIEYLLHNFVDEKYKVDGKYPAS